MLEKTKFIKRYLIAGLLVWLPLWATLLVIKFVVDLLDKTVSLLPSQYQPLNLIGINIPGLGIVITLALLILTGMTVTNFLGERLFKLGERIFKKIPLVGAIYQAVKQVAETIFANNSQAFRKVLLVEYPRRGLWSLAFQTATTTDVVGQHCGGDHQITIFIPTTPNPTSGFLMLVKKEDVKEIDISVDDALKMIISLGVMQPDMSEIKQAASTNGN